MPRNKDNVRMRIKFFLCALFMCLALPNKALPQENSEIYDIAKLNKINFTLNNFGFKLLKNTNQQCTEENCLIDIFINENHIITIDYFSKFTVKLSSKNDETYIVLDNNSRTKINDNKYRAYKGFISMFIKTKYKDSHCAGEGSFEEFGFDEIPVLKNYSNNRFRMYNWNQPVGCISLNAIIQRATQTPQQ